MSTIVRLTVRADGPSRINVEEFTNGANSLMCKIEVWPDRHPGFDQVPLILFPREARALMEALQLIFLKKSSDE